MFGTDAYRNFINCIHNSSKILERIGVFCQDLEEHPFKNAFNGEVCDVFLNGKFLVKCSGGVVIVHDYQSSLKLCPGMVMRISNGICKRYFQRNVYGFFDLEAQ